MDIWCFWGFWLVLIEHHELSSVKWWIWMNFHGTWMNMLMSAANQVGCFLVGLLQAKPWDFTSFTAKVLGMGWSKEALAADVSEERLAAGHTSSALLQTVSHQLPALRFSPGGASGDGPRGNEALQIFKIFKHPRCLCRIVRHGYEWNTRIIMK